MLIFFGFMSFPYFLSKIRYFFITIFVLVPMFLLWQWLSPLGHWSCNTDFSNNNLKHLFKTDSSACLGQPSPLERHAYSPDGKLIMLADPLYFSVFSPRPFSKVELEIVFKPHLGSANAVFEAGFLADAKLWRYQLKPVYNLYLEKLAADWQVARSNNLTLFQKQKRFNSVEDFLENWQSNDRGVCKDFNCLATYNLTADVLPTALRLDNLYFNQDYREFPYAFRGPHQFYVYLDETGLELSGSFIDLNENKDKDDLDILVFSGNKQMATLKIIDNRLEMELSAKPSSQQSFIINREDLPVGLYKIDIRASDDLIINSFRVNSSYLSAINKIWPISEGPVSLVTDTAYLQVKSLSPFSLQEINFSNSSLNLDQIYYQYEIVSDQAGWQEINLAQGGLILENSGVFASDPNSLLNPSYPRLDRFAFSNEQIDFVLADYSQVEALDDGWQRAVLDFESAALYRENNNYNLIMSVPGLRLDNGASGLVEIKEINIKFSGSSLWDKVRSYLMN
jgi:hypothetical protein